MTRVRCLLLVCGLALFFQAPSFAAEASAKRAIVNAQIMIDKGEFKEAVAYLEKAVKQFPQDDVLLALYGDALFESKQMVEAEAAFRRALEINPLNTLAANRVETIRAISNAAVSEQAQQLEELTLDKLFDLIAMALAFALGSLLSRYVKRIGDWNFERRSRKLFLKGLYDDFVDMLEIQISTSELRPLRKSIEFMLQHMNEEQTLIMLNKYVNTEENLQTLTRMVKLSNANRIITH